MIIFTIDIFVYLIMCCMTGMTVDDFSVTGGQNEGGLAFTLMSDGFCLLLFFIRLVYGGFYMKAVLFPQKMDYSYIVEFGKLKWHTKRVKNMRILFKNYALASNVSTIFIFV